MSQQTTSPEDPTTYPELEEADNASYFKTSVPEACRMAARQTRNPTLITGLQSRPGQKRHLDDDDEEVGVEEPQHKRSRAKAVRQAEKGTRAHESTSGTMGREDDADKHAETEQSSRRGRRDCQQSNWEGPSRHQKRGN